MRKSDLIAVICLLLLFHTTPAIGDNRMIQRLEQKLSWRASERFELRGVLSFRFQDRLRDFYFFNWESGVSTYFNDRVKVPVIFRQIIREIGPDWLTTNVLLFDPTVLLLSAGNWQFDLRGRCTYLITGSAVENIRIKPQALYTFYRKGLEFDWYVFNDFYIPLLRQARTESAHYNLFATGVHYPLSPATGLDLRYMLYSGKSRPVNRWSHLHQTLVILEFRI